MAENTLSLNTVCGAERSETRSPKRINRIIFMVTALIALNALLTYSFESRSKMTLKIGNSVPAYSLNLINGAKVTNADFAGKPAVYFFYANWCPCSHRSAWPINRVSEEYKAQGLQVFGVGIQDGAGKLKKFAETYKFQFPVAAEGGQAVADEMGVNITPTTVFVDKDGVIRSVFVGRIDRFDQLTDGLESILPPTA